MKADYVVAEDWEGIYLDDKLQVEGHSIQTAEAMKLTIENEVTELSVYEIDQEYMEELGSLPESFSQLDSSKIF